MEDVGVRFITQGEKEFMNALQKAQTAAVVMGQAIYNAAVAAGRAMVDFASSSIKAASDLNETVSKSQVVFGSSADVITKFAADSANALGMSRNAAIGAAATYGNLFRSMGMGEQQSAAMSTSLVQLAADLASFNNIDPAEALDKLRAGLTGETEPLKSLGINLNEAAIELEATNVGLLKQGQTITPLIKAQASYSLIMKQSALAQGDFARTSGGLANQQRIFAASLENLKATLGTALLPIINKVMAGLIQLFNSPQFQAGVQWVINALGQVADTVIQNWPQIVSIATTVWNTVSGIVTAIVGFFQQNMPAISASFQQVSNTITTIMAWIQGVISTALTAIQGWWASNGASIMASVSTMWSGVQTMFSAAITFIQTLVSFVLANINAFWQAHGDKVLAVVNWLWTTVQTIFNTATSIITSIFNAFTDLLQGNWQAFGDHLLEAWNTLWNLIKSAAEGAWAALSSWFQGVIQAILSFFANTDWGAIGRGIIEGVWNSLKSGWSKLTELISNLASELWKAAKRALGIQSPSTVFYDIGENMMKGWGAGIAKNAMIPITATVQAAVMSAGAAMMAPSTVNQTNNYNLSVITNQSPAVVGQSFAVMQLLAG